MFSPFARMQAKKDKTFTHFVTVHLLAYDDQCSMSMSFVNVFSTTKTEFFGLVRARN